MAQGTHVLRKKANPASLAIQQMEGTEEGTDLSYTAFKVVQINLAFSAPTYNLYSVLNEQLVVNGKSVSSFQQVMKSLLKLFPVLRTILKSYFKFGKQVISSTSCSLATESSNYGFLFFSLLIILTLSMHLPNFLIFLRRFFFSGQIYNTLSLLLGQLTPC